MAYDVGYKKPPKNGRFKKGQSGNPNGRPKGSKNFVTILTKELNQKITVNENGKQKNISRMEAMVKRLVAEALQGERRSLITLIDIMRKTGQMDEVEVQGLIPENYESILDSFVERQQAKKQPAKVNNKTQEVQS